MSITTAIPVVPTATATTRTHLSILHLLGAARYARTLAALEYRHRDDEFGPFFEEIFSHATATVMMSVASVEAYINEQFSDAGQHLSQDFDDIWHKAEKDIDRSSILDKFDWFLRLRGKGRLNLGVAETQNVSALVDLRNALVHFRPEWVNEAKHHVSISVKLKDRIPHSKWLASDPHIFPLAWANHGSASWAVKSCVVFLEWYAVQAGRPNPVEKFLVRLNTT